MTFEGNDDHILVADSSSLDLTTDLTITAWVKVDDNALEMDYVSKWMTGGLGSYHFGQSDTGDLLLALTADGTTYNAFTTTAADLQIGEWTFLAATWNTANDTAVIYQDGRALSTSLTSGTSPASLFNSSTGVNIGARYEGGYANFDGSIDTVRIYNYVRTPAQIAWEYNQGEPIFRYKLDECEGTTAYNTAKNGNADAAGNNGTITIGATGSNTSAGTCNGSAGEAWKDGATGKLGSSLDFDGTDDYIGLGTGTIGTLVNRAPAVTTSVWVKLAGIPTAGNFYQIIGSVVDTGSAGAVDIKVTDTGAVSGGGRSVIGDAHQSILSNKLLSTGTWYNLVLINNFANDQISIYINGVHDKTSSVTFGNSAYTQGTATLADQIGNFATISRYTNGQIDDVRVYNYALTSAQVKDIYNNGAVSFK